MFSNDFNDDIQNHQNARKLQILKGFVEVQDIIEKSKTRQVGEVHANGKWVWTKLTSGKFDWRNIKGKSDNKSTDYSAPKKSEDKKAKLQKRLDGLATEIENFFSHHDIDMGNQSHGAAVANLSHNIEDKEERAHLKELGKMYDDTYDEWEETPTQTKPKKSDDKTHHQKMLQAQQESYEEDNNIKVKNGVDDSKKNITYKRVGNLGAGSSPSTVESQSKRGHIFSLPASEKKGDDHRVSFDSRAGSITTFVDDKGKEYHVSKGDLKKMSYFQPLTSSDDDEDEEETKEETK